MLGLKDGARTPPPHPAHAAATYALPIRIVKNTVIFDRLYIHVVVSGYGHVIFLRWIEKRRLSLLSYDSLFTDRKRDRIIGTSLS